MRFYVTYIGTLQVATPLSTQRHGYFSKMVHSYSCSLISLFLCLTLTVMLFPCRNPRESLISFSGKLQPLLLPVGPGSALFNSLSPSGLDHFLCLFILSQFSLPLRQSAVASLPVLPEPSAVLGEFAFWLVMVMIHSIPYSKEVRAAVHYSPSPFIITTTPRRI